MSDNPRQEWAPWLLMFAVLVLLGLLLRHRTAAPPTPDIQVTLTGAPGTPGPHDICVFAIYRGDGVALPAFERPWCDSIYHRLVPARDQHVSGAAQAQADSFCFQFRSPIAGVTFEQPSCAGRPPARIWQITLHWATPAAP